MNNAPLTIMCLMPILAMVNMLFNQTHFLMTLSVTSKNYPQVNTIYSLNINKL